MNLPMKIETPVNLYRLKRWTILFIVLLVIVIGLQGFFINHLSGEVDELKNEKPPTIPEIGTAPGPTSPTIPWKRDLWQGFSHDPFARMEKMQKDIDEWMQRSGLPNGFGNFPRYFNGFGFSSVSGFEVKEEVDKFIVTGKIPGAKESSINVTIEGRQLHITAETKKENLTKDDRMGQGMFNSHSMFSSRVEKRLTLPGDVDQAGMKIEFDDDLLTVNIPKKAKGSLL